MTPEQFTQARSAICGEVDRLMALLDLIDGDPDLEPSLAGFDGRNMAADFVDLEGDDSDLEEETDDDLSDREPSLGATETWAGSQVLWGQGSPDDREEEAYLPVDRTMRRPLAMLQREAEAARAASDRLGEIIARLSGVPAPASGSNLRLVRS